MSDKHLSFADLQISKRRLLQTVHSNCRIHWRPLEQAIEVRELEATEGMKGVPLLYCNLSFLMSGDVLLLGTLKKKKQSSTSVQGNQEDIQGGGRERSWTFGLQQESQEWKQQISGQEDWDYRLARIHNKMMPITSHRNTSQEVLSSVPVLLLPEAAVSITLRWKVPIPRGNHVSWVRPSEDSTVLSSFSLSSKPYVDRKSGHWPLVSNFHC